MSEEDKKIIDGIEYQLVECGDLHSLDKDGQCHSFDDKPAIIWPDGTKYWYKRGLPHRDNDKPTIIYADGTKYWYKDGKIHRDNDKPAIIYSNGRKEWYKNGNLHRDNDKPAIIWSDGSKFWWINGRPQLNKYYICLYIEDNKQYKEFFETQSEAKRCESDMLSDNICAWVIEND